MKSGGGLRAGEGEKSSWPARLQSDATNGRMGEWAKGRGLLRNRHRGEGPQWLPGPGPGARGGDTTHACIVVVAVWKLKRFSLGNQVRMGVWASSGRDRGVVTRGGGLQDSGGLQGDGRFGRSRGAGAGSATCTSPHPPVGPRDVCLSLHSSPFGCHSGERSRESTACPQGALGKGSSPSRGEAGQGKVAAPRGLGRQPRCPGVSWPDLPHLPGGRGGDPEGTVTLRFQTRWGEAEAALPSPPEPRPTPSLCPSGACVVEGPAHGQASARGPGGESSAPQEAASGPGGRAA